MNDPLGRAEQLLDLNRPAQAEEVLRAFLLDEPESAPALRLLTLALLEDRERDSDALRAADRAVVVDPDDEQGHRLRSIALLRVDRVPEAVASAREAVRRDPQMWQTHYCLGLALRSGRLPRSRDALECANQAVRLAPHQSQPHNLAGLCLDDLGLHDEARRAFEEALALDPTSATALNNLAATHLDGGRLRAGIRMLSSGLSASPQAQALHENYDVLLLKLASRLYIALGALGIVLQILAATGAPYLARVITVVALITAYALITHRVTRLLPRGSSIWVRGLFRRSSNWRRLGLVLLAVLTVGVIVMGVAPAELAVSTGAALVVALQFVGIGVVTVGVIGAVVSLFRRG